MPAKKTKSAATTLIAKKTPPVKAAKPVGKKVPAPKKKAGPTVGDLLADVGVAKPKTPTLSPSPMNIEFNTLEQPVPKAPSPASAALRGLKQLTHPADPVGTAVATAQLSAGFVKLCRDCAIKLDERRVRASGDINVALFSKTQMLKHGQHTALLIFQGKMPGSPNKNYKLQITDLHSGESMQIPEAGFIVLCN